MFFRLDPDILGDDDEPSPLEIPDLSESSQYDSSSDCPVHAVPPVANIVTANKSRFLPVSNPIDPYHIQQCDNLESVLSIDAPNNYEIAMFADILTMASKPVGGERAKRVRPEDKYSSFTQMYRSLRLEHQNQFPSPASYCSFLTKREDIEYNGASPLNFFLEPSRSISVLLSFLALPPFLSFGIYPPHIIFILLILFSFLLTFFLT